jgi:hypothetical protein
MAASSKLVNLDGQDRTGIWPLLYSTNGQSKRFVIRIAGRAEIRPKRHARQDALRKQLAAIPDGEKRLRGCRAIGCGHDEEAHRCLEDAT